MATRMKSLLKGLRYISQKIDNEKEPDIVIGVPTDVKHVAHIGWDGPSVDSPSWMNEFKPPSANGGQDNRESTSEEVPKPVKRESTTSLSTSAIDSPTKIKTVKQRGSRRASSKASLGIDVPDGTTTRPSVDLETEESPRKRQQSDHVPKRFTTRKSKTNSKEGTGPRRSSSRLSTAKTNQETSSTTNDNHNHDISDKETTQVAGLKDEKRYEKREEMNEVVSS